MAATRFPHPEPPHIAARPARPRSRGADRLDGEGPTRRTACLPAFALAAFVLAPSPSALAQASVPQRQRSVDTALNALRRDGVLLRLLTQPPQPWPGPTGPQPFDQQPPAAQQDFRGVPQGAVQGGARGGGMQQIDPS